MIVIGIDPHKSTHTATAVVDSLKLTGSRRGQPTIWPSPPRHRRGSPASRRSGWPRPGPSRSPRSAASAGHGLSPDLDALVVRLDVAARRPALHGDLDRRHGQRPASSPITLRCAAPTRAAIAVSSAGVQRTARSRPRGHSARRTSRARGRWPWTPGAH